MLAIARAGAAAGCTEALFTLGDKPELRYKVARDRARGARLRDDARVPRPRCAKLVLEETGLLPHLNPGVMSREELVALRPVSASMGIMLETTAERLSARGGPHWASPDKDAGAPAGDDRPRRRAADPLHERDPDRDRRDPRGAARCAARRCARSRAARPPAGGDRPELPRQAGHADGRRTRSRASTTTSGRSRRRGCCSPADVAVQAPPNLAYDDFPRLLDAGIDDWGGVSPGDDRPRQPRGAVAGAATGSREATRSRGLELAPRLPVYPRVPRRGGWLDPAVLPTALRASDALGLAREDGWHPGEAGGVPFVVRRDALPVDTAPSSGRRSSSRLFQARGEERQRVFAAADRLRREVCGDEVSYVVTRNIQYTNVCYFRCGFCAFSKGRLAANLRGAPYLVPLDEIVRRAQEAWDRGATEVCLQGGIHPAFTGDYYASVVEAIRAELPDLHIHAFSALEVWQGAETLGLPLEEYLARLRALGLGSLPGTAAEILDDEVRAVICPDKVSTDQWLAVHAAAHRVGLRSNVTIMFGHVEAPEHWARHLLRARAQQERSGGFTEFVPLPFVHMEAPMWLKGRARSRADVRRVAAPARRRAARAPSGDHEHPGVLGEARPGGSGGRAPRRRERPRRDADERVDLALGRLRARAGDAAGVDGGADPARTAARRGSGRRSTPTRPPSRRAASFAAAPLTEPLNPPVRDAGLKAPPRLVRPGLLARAR